MAAIPHLEGRLGDQPIQVRAINEWDIPDVLIAYQDDPALHRRLGLRRPPTGAQEGMRVETAEAEQAAGKRVTLSVVEPDSEYCRGRIEVEPIDWSTGSALLRIWIAPHFRRQGYGRRALELGSKWLFEEVGLSELVLVSDGDNEALRRMAGPVGFVEREEPLPAGLSESGGLLAALRALAARLPGVGSEQLVLSLKAGSPEAGSGV